MKKKNNVVMLEGNSLEKSVVVNKDVGNKNVNFYEIHKNI